MRASILMIALALACLTACGSPAASEVYTTAESADASYGIPPLGVVLDNAQTVIDLDPGGAAQTAGVRLGDVLLTLNSVPFSDVEGVGEAKRRAVVEAGEIPPAQVMVTLVLNRDGQQVSLPVDLVKKTPIDPPATVTPFFGTKGEHYF